MAASSRAPWLLSLALAAFAGCGGPSTPGTGDQAAAVGPHGGLLLPLPGERGFGEIIPEPIPRASARADGVLAVYFLTPDLKSALTPTPTQVALKLQTPDAPDPIDVSLSPQANAKDPLAASKFTSKPGPFLLDQLFGELTATIDGEPFNRPFARSR